MKPHRWGSNQNRFGDRNPNAKMTWDLVAQLRKAHEGGEGVMSLRRAFTIAGAQSVLASHWRVGDEATSRLITEFLRHWRAGKPRVEALREAQLALLRSPEFASPFYWAAFTLTGQWR